MKKLRFPFLNDITILSVLHIAGQLSIHQRYHPAAHDVHILTGVGGHDNSGAPAVQFVELCEVVA